MYLCIRIVIRQQLIRKRLPELPEVCCGPHVLSGTCAAANLYRKGSTNAMAGKVRIRTVSNCSIVVTILLSGLCLGMSIFGIQKYAVLRSSMQEYIECETAIQRFLQGSDTLTQQARLAAATGDTAYIDGYFQEAYVDRNREKALAEVSRLEGHTEAVKALEESLQISRDLMQTEYYAMRLVESAAGTERKSWPSELRSIELSDTDQALSDKEKLARAQELMNSPDYETVKSSVSDGADGALDTLSTQIRNRQNRAADIFFDIFKKILVGVAAFAVLMLVICFVMRRWIVRPLLKYNDNIRYGTIFPICGAYELQLLARTYNKVFLENEEREKLMKHQAEHDPLTGALNRGAFDQILKLFEKDARNFALILIDVDTFKSVNDTYGHAVGDIILKRVAHLLTAGFRTIDHVCRIGGDEFAVVMMDVTSDLGYTIEDKIREINRQLSVPEENIPAVSLSVGAAFTDRENPGESLFKDADSALYYVKEHGRNGCRIYSGADEG